MAGPELTDAWPPPPVALTPQGVSAPIRPAGVVPDLASGPLPQTQAGWLRVATDPDPVTRKTPAS